MSEFTFALGKLTWNEIGVHLSILLVFPFAFFNIWWAAVTINAVLNPQGFVNIALRQLDKSMEGIWHSKVAQEDFVSVDYAVWIGAWSRFSKVRVQCYVHRDDGSRLLWRLWWFNIRYTALIRGAAFYWIGATYWLIVERIKLLGK